MLRLTSIWLSGIRHALVAVAVLATLMSAFGFHLHPGDSHEHTHSVGVIADDGRAHDHLATRFTGELGDADAGDLGDELDPDGCGHCHCQLAATDLPAMIGAVTPTDQITALLIPRDPLIRDGITYQPDPPPVLG